MSTYAFDPEAKPRHCLQRTCQRLKGWQRRGQLTKFTNTSIDPLLQSFHGNAIVLLEVFDGDGAALQPHLEQVQGHLAKFHTHLLPVFSSSTANKVRVAQHHTLFLLVATRVAVLINSLFQPTMKAIASQMPSGRCGMFDALSMSSTLQSRVSTIHRRTVVFLETSHDHMNTKEINAPPNNSWYVFSHG